MIKKLFIPLIILGLISCKENQSGIIGTWVQLGWQSTPKETIMSGGFVEIEMYWEFSSSELSVYESDFTKRGSMEYKILGDTIEFGSNHKCLHTIINDTLRTKEILPSESNTWKVLIRN